MSVPFALPGWSLEPSGSGRPRYMTIPGLNGPEQDPACGPLSFRGSGISRHHHHTTLRCGMECRSELGESLEIVPGFLLQSPRPHLGSSPARLPGDSVLLLLACERSLAEVREEVPTISLPCWKRSDSPPGRSRIRSRTSRKWRRGCGRPSVSRTCAWARTPRPSRCFVPQLSVFKGSLGESHEWTQRAASALAEIRAARGMSDEVEK